MIRSVLISLLIFCFVSMHAQSSADAVKHFGAGIVIGGVGGYAAHKIFNGQRGWTWAGAVGSSFGAALAKETLYDKPRGASFEGRDILFTTLGGVVSGLVLDMFLKNSRRRGGGGKNCGCLVAKLDVDTKIELPSSIGNGTGDIASEIQAAYYLR